MDQGGLGGGATVESCGRGQAHVWDCGKGVRTLCAEVCILVVLWIPAGSPIPLWANAIHASEPFQLTSNMCTIEVSIRGTAGEG